MAYALGQRTADAGSFAGNAEFDVSAVFAAKGKTDERRMVGAFDIESGGSLPDNGRMLVAETDAATGAAILYGEPKPEYPERHGAL